jgi:hypothetical protein
VIVAADAADSTGNKMRIARVFAPHENAVAPKNGRCAVTIDDLIAAEVYFRVNAEAADDTGDRIPSHLHDIVVLIRHVFLKRRSRSA